METVQQNGRFTLSSSKFHSNIYSSLFAKNAVTYYTKLYTTEYAVTYYTKLFITKYAVTYYTKLCLTKYAVTYYTKLCITKYAVTYYTKLCITKMDKIVKQLENDSGPHKNAEYEDYI